MNIDDKRGTGRTTTLLRAALQRATENQRNEVVIVVSTYHEFDHLVVLMTEICRMNYTHMRIVSHSKTFLVSDKLRLRVLELRNDAVVVPEFIVRGVDERDTFFDHHAIETFIGRKALDLWLRYDGQGAPTPRKVNG